MGGHDHSDLHFAIAQGALLWWPIFGANRQKLAYRTFIRWHSTMDGMIATRMRVLTPPYVAYARWNFGEVWSGNHWLTTAWQYLLSPAIDTRVPWSTGTGSYCSYQGQAPRSGRGVSRSRTQSSGTVYQPLCELLLSPPRCSLDIWRPTCLVDRQQVWGRLRRAV